MVLGGAQGSCLRHNQDMVNSLYVDVRVNYVAY